MTLLRTRFPLVAFPFLLVALLVPATTSARAGDRADSARGVVDGSFLERFVPEDDEGTFVEVSLTKPLLELAAQVLEGQDPALAAMIRQLHSVSARVIELADDEKDLEEAGRIFREVAGRLREKGWEPLAKVRDGGDEVHVLVLPGGGTVDGLTVMVRSADGELVFANIAGKIDLSRLGDVLGQLQVPGMAEALSVLPGKGSRNRRAAPGAKGAPAAGGEGPGR